MDSFIKRLAGLALTGAAVVIMSACGGKADSGSEKPENAETKEWAYVPEFLEIEDTELSYYDMQCQKDTLYYTVYEYDIQTGQNITKIKGYSLTDRQITELPFAIGQETASGEDGSYEGVSLNRYLVTEDQGLLAVLSHYSGSSDGDYSSWQELVRYDNSGEEKYNLNLDETMGDEGDIYGISMLLEDSQGRVYLSGGNNVVWLFNENGGAAGKLEVPGAGWISGMGIGKDGEVYISYLETTGSNASLSRLDFEKKALGEKYSNFVLGNSTVLCSGAEKDFLVQDSAGVYEYDLESQTTEKLFDWLDCEINGDYVNTMAVLTDGRILAVMEDWNTQEGEIALLTRTTATQTEQKEEIVIGTISGSSDLQAAAVKFNRSNDKYHVSIKQYADYNNWTDTTMSDAIASLQSDLAAGKQIDLIDLSNLNTKKLAAKGVFEDLTPYLESSQKLQKDNLLENVLEAYTYEDKLIGVPAVFTMQTVIGPASELGTEAGWTMEELIAYADKHPDAAIFDSTDQQSMLYNCMRYNQDTFIDWESQKCDFNNQAFKDILEFVSRFPENYEWKENDLSEASKIQKGYVLLSNAYIYSFNEIQLYHAMFNGDINCIGFPTSDGSIGCAMEADSVYAINAKSGLKDAAWSFMEFFLDTKMSSTGGWGFPTDKTRLQKMAEDAVKVEYVTDDAGNTLLDENGNPVVSGGTASIAYQDGWTYEYHAVTQAEVDEVLRLVETARPVSTIDDSILNIIQEEAAPFFKGQKSVEEAAAVIQSRVQIYVNENS